MDYDYTNQENRQWPQPTTSGFSSPVSPSPGYYYTPSQQSPSSDSRPTSSNLTLNLSSLSVTSPINLHHSHPGISPITPVSPPNFSPAHLSPQPPFQFNFDSTEDSSLLLAQRRPSTGSHSTSSSELGVEKSVPRKRSLTNTAPPPTHHTHAHSHSYGGHTHVLPHPIITTTASSPPPLSEPSSQGPLTPASSQPPNQIDINATYDDPDGVAGYSMADQDSEDEGGGKPNATGPSLGVIGKPMGTNNFVTKLYQMINDSKSQHFIAWTELGTSFVVSNVGEFSRSILGSHFKHNNFSSFVRQLNMYGFHKINRTPRAQRTSTTSQTWEFSHPKFLRARPDLLDAIKRKALEPDPRERGRVELPGEVARLLNDMRDENKALWREISRLGGRVPSHVANTLSQSSNSSLGGSSTAPKLHIGGDDEDDDGSDEGFAFNVMGPGSMGGGMGMGMGGGEAWMNWASAEMRRERRKVERLTGIVRTLCDAIGSVSPTLIQELNALNAPSPSPSPVPPSPIPSEHSPNIFITSPPSPSPSHSHSHTHSPSHSHSSHHSQGHAQIHHPHSHHPSVPMLNIPQYALHTSTPSPTSSEFSAFGRHGRQPSITLTPTPDVEGIREGSGREKRQRRTGSVVSVGSVGSVSSPMGGGSGMGGVTGLGGGVGGEEDGEGEMNLGLDLDLDMDVGSGGEKKQQQRARSDSAPTWVTGQNAGAGVGAGGLTANWGRPRSGSGFGR